jgi:hypothetical protein
VEGHRRAAAFGWRNCLWAPRWRTSTNPSASSRFTTS